LNKIERNITNDKKKKVLLKKDGYKIITIWECSLKPLKRQRTLSRLARNLK